MSSKTAANLIRAAIEAARADGCEVVIDADLVEPGDVDLYKDGNYIDTICSLVTTEEVDW